MNKPSVRTNYIYNTVFQILTLLIPLITTPYVSRVLGAEGIGQHTFANAMVTYFTVFATFGSSLFGQREIAFYRDDKIALSRTFVNIFSFRVVSSFFAIILYFLYLLLFGGFSVLNFIVALNVFNVAIDISWFYQGIENFRKVVIRNFFIKIFSLICVYVFIHKTDDVWLYALIISGSTIIGNISMWIDIRRMITIHEKPEPFKDIKAMFYVFLPTIAVQLYTLLDKSMIGIIAKSDYANGCYEQAEKIEKVALTVVISAGAVILPRVASLFGQNDNEGVRKYIYASYRYTFLSAIPIAVGLIAIAPVFVPLFLGAGFDDAVLILQLLSVLVLVVGLAYTTGYAYLIPTKQQNIYTISVSIAAGVNLIFNTILIKNFSAVGAAIATILAEVTGCCIQIGYCCVKKQLTLSRITEGLWKYLISAALMFIIISMIPKFTLSPIFTVLIMIISGGILYGVSLILLRDDFFIENLKKVLSYFFKGKSKSN